VEQLLQELDPVVAANVPIRQDEQTVAEADEYLPVPQEPVTADNPVVAQYDPAVHSVQLVVPVLAA